LAIIFTIVVNGLVIDVQVIPSSEVARAPMDPVFCPPATHTDPFQATAFTLVNELVTDVQLIPSGE
jgi:hypothetical protein